MIAESMPATYPDLPKPPSLWKSIGPSFVLLGMALGSGELIMWPYLTARYGLGLLWGALLGISLQYVLNTEIMRYTLAWGESVFVGWRKLWKYLPVWFILSTAIPWSIPGFSSAVAAIFHHLLPNVPVAVAGVFFLLITGLLLSMGKSAYHTMEKFQKISILISVSFLVILTLGMAHYHDWIAAMGGLVGQGEGWKFFPPAVSLMAFLGAFAYSGAGGNLNLAQSYYVKEKGLGMAQRLPKITALFGARHQEHLLTGQTFSMTAANMKTWKKWWWLISTEHLIVFWGLGLISIIFLAVLAYTTVHNHPQVAGSNLQFLFLEAGVIGSQTWPLIRVWFLVVGMLMLFSTQLGVMASSARIISENLILLTKPLTTPVKLSRLYYMVLWTQLALGMVILLLGFSEPQYLLTLGAVLNAFAMLGGFILILILNKKSLPLELQPKLGRTILLVLGIIVFAVFCLLTLASL